MMLREDEMFANENERLKNVSHDCVGDGNMIKIVSQNSVHHREISPFEIHAPLIQSCCAGHQWWSSFNLKTRSRPSCDGRKLCNVVESCQLSNEMALEFINHAVFDKAAEKRVSGCSRVGSSAPRHCHAQQHESAFIAKQRSVIFSHLYWVNVYPALTVRWTFWWCVS